MELKAIVRATVTVSDLSPRQCSISCPFLAVKPMADSRNKSSYCAAFMGPGDALVTSLAREPEREPQCIAVFGLDNRTDFGIGEQTELPITPKATEPVRVIKFPETVTVPKSAISGEALKEVDIDDNDGEENDEGDIDVKESDIEDIDDASEGSSSASDADIDAAATALLDPDDPAVARRNEGWKRYDPNAEPPHYEFADVYGNRFGRWGRSEEREIVKKVKVMPCNDTTRDLLKLEASEGYGSIAGSDDQMTIVSWKPHTPRGRKPGRNSKLEGGH